MLTHQYRHLVKRPISETTKEELVRTIHAYGCRMLLGRMKADDTKEEIVAHLRKCDCPVLKRMFDLTK